MGEGGTGAATIEPRSAPARPSEVGPAMEDLRRGLERALGRDPQIKNPAEAGVFSELPGKGLRRLFLVFERAP